MNTNEKNLWETPTWLIDFIKHIDRFDYDPCPKNPTEDGLIIHWHGKVFCNPPYEDIHLWYEKALSEKPNCEKITMLLPVWSSQIWFKRIIENEDVFIIPRKINFNGLYQNRGLASFKSMIVFIK